MDGLPPGIFILLLPDWILCIATLFNSVFMSGSYPDLLSKAKFLNIFKTGDRKDPSNYRGIYVMSSVAKLRYGVVLSNRSSDRTGAGWSTTGMRMY